MDREKLRMYLGVGVGVIVLLIILTWILGDTVQPLFRNTLITQNTLVELSDSAASDANEPETRTLAARIASTTGSDRSQLLKLYESSYGESVKAVRKKEVEKLDDTHEGYDARYRELALKHLEQSRQQMRALQKELPGKEINDIFNQAHRNHEAHIQHLSRNSP